MKFSRENNRLPLRVLQVCDLQAGGISSLILSVCTQMDREKVNFDYLVYRNQEEFDDHRVRKLGGRKLIADDTGARNHPEKIFRRFFRTWKILREEKPEIFHINASSPYECLVGIAGRLAGTKNIILHSHTSQLEKRGAGQKFFQEIFRLLLPLCGNHYFACSEKAAKFLYGKRLQKKVVYIKNGIRTEKFRFDKKTRVKMREDYQTKDALVIGHVGRFCEAKNHSYLLEIFAEIQKKVPKAFLLLIGQGELEEELMSRAVELNLRDSIIHIASTDRVEDFFCMMDVFLLPSLYEGFPIAGVEAQASGLPCVFSSRVTKEAALTDRAYFLSLNRPAAEWAKFVSAAAGQVSDAREKYAEAVREAGYDIQDTAHWLQEFYLGL